MKKFVVGLLLAILVGVGVLFVVNGKDNYDSKKYSASATDGLNIGSKIEFTLPDQFDKAHRLDDSIKKLIVVFAKSTGHTVKEFLKRQDGDYLKNRKTLFIADISPMPTVIRNTFALPDLKKSKHSILLIYDKDIAKKLKDEKSADKISIVTLDKRVVKDVKFVTTIEELSKKI